MLMSATGVARSGRMMKKALASIVLLLAACAEPPSPPPRQPPGSDHGYVTLFFHFDSTELTPQSLRGLDHIVEVWNSFNDNQKIDIEAHADRAGPTAANKMISEKRGQIIKEYLLSKGVSEDRISMSACGDTKPLVITAPGVLEPQNRRAVTAIVPVNSRIARC
jgi:OOP family OmpA-OmpF porin